MNRTLEPTHPGIDYAGIFDRLERKFDTHLDQVAVERASAPRLLAELLALAPRERRRAAVRERRFHLFALASHALEQSEALAATDRPKALELAHLARLLAVRTRGPLCGDSALTELREKALTAEASLLLTFGGLTQ